LRLNESSQQRQERLSRVRERVSISRSLGSREEREILSARSQGDIRRLADRTARAIARSSETAEVTATRQAADGAARASARSSQSAADTSDRQAADRAARASARSSQSAADRTARQAAHRAETAAARSSESAEVTAARQATDRAARAAVRSSQSVAETSARQSTDRAARAIARAAQTVDETSTRQSADALARRAARTRPWVDKAMAAFNYSSDINYTADQIVSIGNMSKLCRFCFSLKWQAEPPGLCCNSGKIRLPSLGDPPQPIKDLLSVRSDLSVHFQSNVRKYNSCFQMTSFGASRRIVEPGFMPTFKIQGQVYHRIGALQPAANEDPKFLQIYFVSGSDNQARRRSSIVNDVKIEIILQLQELLHRENRYVQSFKSAMETMRPDYNIVIHADRAPPGQHTGRFNTPSATSEVAVVMTGEGHNPRDIVVNLRDNTLHQIADTHRSYDALQYPIIFWQGQDGYHFGLRHFNPETGVASPRKISCMDFYCYHFMVRQQNFNLILRFKDLFQQFLVDMDAKIESERLRYIRLNQRRLRAENYALLRDAIATDGRSTDVGQLVVLPSSFTGGPRYMHERTQDAMTYVRAYGRPHLFITFTCNPSWDEISRELYPGQKPYDRHDLVARVFRLKLTTLMKLFYKGKVFGEVRCYIYTVEWQKRGLPHAHILLWLSDDTNVRDVDRYISAELPDPDNDPSLFNVVKTQMVHGPCGDVNPLSPCMRNDQCSKRYPRQFVTDTVTGRDGYPLYRRRSPRDGGFTTTLRIRGRNVQVDNKWIVPYCPLLSRIFNAHINVEYCSSIKSIKYVCKYINKGSDMAVFSVERPDQRFDEVSRYEIGRYISSNEAAWRIFPFSIHERHPAVVHLENGQRVYFTEQTAERAAQVPQDTTLTAFFRLCQIDTFAATLFYHQVPKHFIWQSNTKTWVRRKTGRIVPEYPGVKEGDSLGRVYTVHPTNSECFHLRLLLHVVKGPTSFHDLRSVDGVLCETYQQACQMRGLLQDDDHWKQTLTEAVAIRSPNSLRSLFAVMLNMCAISNPRELWDNFKEHFAEDLLHRQQQHDPDAEFSEAIFNETLALIQHRLREMGSRDLHSFGLPRPTRIVSPSMEIFDVQHITSFVIQREAMLVPDQKSAFDAIMHDVTSQGGSIFFIDAPGGTGKTFLLNLLIAKIRQTRSTPIAVASSGIASTLLSGGKTAHSFFKLPLNLARTETPTCNISRRSPTALQLQQCQLIVWDECTMSHKAAFEAVDRSLRDIRRSHSIMGGITLVMAGDFRQTLPVIPRGTKADELAASVKTSYIWHNVRRFSLTTNMRVHRVGDQSAATFAQCLLNIGNGVTMSNTPGVVPVSAVGQPVSSIQDLMDSVFPDLNSSFTNRNWLLERAILAPTNDSVKRINHLLLTKLSGETTELKSIDTAVDATDSVNYPVEFLNSLSPSGLPPHSLKLRVGAPVILLRNLHPPLLCNGTRLIVARIQSHIIEAVIASGESAGQQVLLPRIPIIPSDLPFQFKRLQFPIRLSFAMTINKSQGQTIKVVGVNLDKPCFSHGQLYVACSRVSSAESLFIYAPGAQTNNVVYRETLI